MGLCSRRSRPSIGDEHQGTSTPSGQGRRQGHFPIKKVVNWKNWIPNGKCSVRCLHFTAVGILGGTKEIGVLWLVAFSFISQRLNSPRLGNG